jgi:IS30 family transposase
VGRPAGWMLTRTGRPAMRSPGRPPIQRDVERAFWVNIAQGMTSEDAAVACGVSGPVGSRWFRERGGMPSISLTPPSGRYLSFAEREELALLRAKNFGVRTIARELGRSPSTISRELRRNAATRAGKLEYRASVAQWKAELMAARPKTAKLLAHPHLRDYVQDRLSGVLRGPDGVEIAGPAVPTWKGRSKPHRQDRRWSTAWSPEQIANRLPLDFPDDKSMRISHEAIYQALYVQSRGALKRELVACLRTGRALRVPRSRSRNKPGAHVTRDVVLSERPAEADDRAVPGHWEGDLIIGLERSAIGTLVERTTRYTMLVHLPRAEGYGAAPRTKNGPALAGYGAVMMKDALATTMTTLPEQLTRSLTWDRGKELSQHAQLTIDTGIAVYFADPHSPWQRPTNENTNGLLRQYFPKGTDLSRWTAEEIDAVASALNSRPRKVLEWKTPAEALDKHLRSLQQAGVASTG